MNEWTFTKHRNSAIYGKALLVYWVSLLLLMCCILTVTAIQTYLGTYRNFFGMSLTMLYTYLVVINNY